MDIPELSAAENLISHQNQLLRRECQRHALTCSRPHCILKTGQRPVFFYVPEPSADQLDVPDSLQPGHGLKFHLPLVSKCSTVFCEAVSAECVVSSRSWDQTWKVQCLCPAPAFHSHHLELLCETYNKA